MLRARRASPSAEDLCTHVRQTAGASSDSGIISHLALGITAFVGCGTPTPDAPESNHTMGIDRRRWICPGGRRTTRWSHRLRTRTSGSHADVPLGLPAQHASTPEARITDATRGTRSANDDRVQIAASPADTPLSDERADADQAQREARQRWFAEMQESPSAAVRLQALELWAQQPSDALDPETFALLDDEDAQVRARAEQLWEQQLSREAGATAP